MSAFVDENDFGYRLLSDTEREVSSAFGAKKSEDEKWNDWPRRISYLIDPEGKIAKCYRVDDVGTHPEDVLRDLKDLAG